MKYKLWDKENKEFLEDTWETEYAVLKNGNIIEIYDNGFGEGYSISDLENIEVLQFTGLQDRNGKEIYEGDILKYNFPYDGRLKHVSPVKFLETEASFGIKDRYENEIPLYRITANNYFEVVGNIYENEELLKSEERKND